MSLSLQGLLLHSLLLVAVIRQVRKKVTREASYFQQRPDWNQFSSSHAQRGTFKARLRMSKVSFDKLLSFLRVDLCVNEEQAFFRGGSIVPEICLHCTLRWLAGGSHLDITDVAGVSKPSFYRVVWKTVIAICNCQELDIVFPQTKEEVNTAIEGFASISHQQAVINCTAVIDGFLFGIKTPTKKTVGNVRSFFSGHCQCCGANIQAGVDHHCRFTYLAFAAPGVTQDRSAINQCSLAKLVDKLPPGVCAIGDAAYDPMEHMVPVFYGADRRNPAHNNFNFYASQLRIRVEMAFGMMTKKWGALQRPCTASLKNASPMMQAIARLHNCVVTERLMETGAAQEEVRETRRGGSSCLRSVPEDEDGNPIRLDALVTGTFEGHSEL